MGKADAKRRGIGLIVPGFTMVPTEPVAAL